MFYGVQVAEPCGLTIRELATELAGSEWDRVSLDYGQPVLPSTKDRGSVVVEVNFIKFDPNGETYHHVWVWAGVMEVETPEGREAVRARAREIRALPPSSDVTDPWATWGC